MSRTGAQVITALKRQVPEEWKTWSARGIDELRVRVENLKDVNEYEHLLRRKTRCELVLLSACVCGIELCYAAETAFISPTLLTIGITPSFMTLFWCISPALGFFLVPVLGSMSDSCKLKLGRRRPFILLLSCGIVAGLFLVPIGASMSIMGSLDCANETALHNISETDRWAAISRNWLNHHVIQVCITVVGMVVLDFSCDACQSPSRSYMLDVCLPDDHPRGLSTFTIMAGVGGSFGYLLGSLNWGSVVGLGANLIQQVKIVFMLALIFYLCCVLLTVDVFCACNQDKLNTVDTPETDRKIAGFS